jgi:acylpyruvate hydrolase
MRLATIRIDGGHAAVKVDGDTAVETGARDVGELLATPGWSVRAAQASGRVHDLSTVDYAPVVPNPGKIVCVGLNYRRHILEMGRDLPEYPTLFAKFTDALIGAHDDIRLPAASEAIDWEAELAVVIGETVRHVDREQATTAIAGYSILNDVTARDYQYRTLQWLQGKTFEATTPFGPVLVTPDELPDGLDLACEIDGETMQSANTGDLVFDPADLVSYLSDITTLRPGDVIATGTPGGVGHARKPPRYLTHGTVMTTRISGIGALVNKARATPV